MPHGIEGEYGYYPFEITELFFLGCHQVGGSLQERAAYGIKAVEKGFTALDEPFCSGSRRLYTAVGYVVEHGDVAFVAYANHDRERELRHGGREVVVLEALQVERRSAATYYDHAVPAVGFGGYAF